MKKHARQGALKGFGWFWLRFLSCRSPHTPGKVLSCRCSGRQARPEALRVAQDRLAEKPASSSVQNNDLSNTSESACSRIAPFGTGGKQGADVVLAGTVQRGKGGSQSLGVLLTTLAK